MSLKRIRFESRQEWLKGRMQGIGASEAAATCGMSPRLSPSALWQLKTNRKKETDLSNSEVVNLGIKLEPAVRGLFGALHPEYEIEYHAFDILYQEERPWLFATLDGELIDQPGRRGILEIKTSTPRKKGDWLTWSDGHMPQHYYIQCLHQLLATGYDFVILFGVLMRDDGEIETRTYTIERADCEDDMQWLLEKETEFWRHIKDDTVPRALIFI